MPSLKKSLAYVIANHLVLGTTVSRSGNPLENYVDVRGSYGNPKVRNALADMLWIRSNEEFDCVAGSGLGGIPLADTISSRHGVNLTMVRPISKEYGTHKKIEGYVPRRDDRILFVDDVLTTGSSTMEANAVLRETGARVIRFSYVLFRGECDPSSLPGQITWLLTLQEILDAKKQIQS